MNILYTYHLKCKEKHAMKDEKKFDKLEDLRERVVDLSETERKKQETANEIQKTLLGLVYEKNEKADSYEKGFKRWMESKIAKKNNRQSTQEMTKKYGTTKPNMQEIEKHKAQYSKENYKDILEKIKKQHKTKEDIKDEIFTIIKRAFNKNITLHEGSDIDKEASLFLLKVTGFFKDNKGEKIDLQESIQEVRQGESGKKWLTIDSWGTINGIKINKVNKQLEQGKTSKSFIGSQVIVSEHSDLSPESKKVERPTSSAHMIYYMFDQLEQLPTKNKEQLQRFMDFIDIVDSLDYQASGIDYINNYKTLFGLYRNLKIEDIYKYFEDPTHTGFEILPDNFLETYIIKRHYRKNGVSVKEDISLKKISQQQKERIENSIHQLEEIDKKWQFGNFNNERFMIALGKEVNDWAQVASYYDCGLLKIFPSGDFYMFSPRVLPKKILDFDTDEHFLTIRSISKENLEKILGIFEFNTAKPEILKEKIIAYRESIKSTDSKESKEDIISNLKNRIKELKDSSREEIKKEKEKSHTGIINNISGKHIYVNITPTISWLIKSETKEKALQIGDNIQVQVDQVPEEEGKLLTLSIIPAKV